MLRARIIPRRLPFSRSAHTASAESHARLENFVQHWRLNGHLNSNLDPLGISFKPIGDESFDLKKFKLDSVDPSHVFDVRGVLNMGDKSHATIGEIVAHLKKSYSSACTASFFHVETPEERAWIADRLESSSDLSAEEKKHVHELMIRSEVFDHFLAKKFGSLKRYGLEGAESMIPAFDAMARQSATEGAKNMIVAMPHRGRLNLLVQYLGYPARALFHKIRGNTEFPEGVFGATGDVISHIGISTDKQLKDGNSIHVSLLQNPSHLEIGNPVGIGKTRAKQADGEDSVSMVIHGDAAFAGQGVNQECFAMSQLPGYTVNGSLHVIVNNQLGFTSPSATLGRSSRYSGDLGKMVGAPLFLANADCPEDVVKAARIAAEYRAKFKKDVLLEIIGYRKHGHNELDEPAFTSPVMYKNIRSRPMPPTLYTQSLVSSGVVDEASVEALKTAENSRLDSEFKSTHTPEMEHFKGKWSGIRQPKNEKEIASCPQTGVSEEKLKQVAMQSITLPAEFTAHDRLLKYHNAARQKVIEKGEQIDWATAEAMAVGTLLQEGFNYRLSGQDATRGTFSHRHFAFYDQKTNEPYYPLAHLPGSKGRFEVIPSHLSELAVMGFEYGYSTENPKNLVCWEAQYGDFANGAQMVIDLFPASAEPKWIQQSGLVLLLPHGFDGTGPEHSSSRIERFLQLCDGDWGYGSIDRSAGTNMHIVHPTTPANYFHLLRRQMHREFRKPLVVISPKTLLRLPAAVSTMAEMGPGTSFRPIIGDTTADPASVERVVICSGKYYYDLAKERSAKGLDKSVALIRIEELCPFPYELIEAELAKYSRPGVRFVWCQEEHQNMGAYTYVAPRLQKLLNGEQLVYVGRAASSSVATGISFVHKAEAEAILRDVFTV